MGLFFGCKRQGGRGREVRAHPADHRVSRGDCGAVQQCEACRGTGQGEAHEHDARGCPDGMKRPRRGSDGEAMKYGMHGIPAQEFSMLIIRQRVKGKAV